jgi:enoyl-CoA hydratase/long-chain 3-hydroxyacyl-CoA dehydrogenase
LSSFTTTPFLDIGAIFGIGFAPFRGGPFRFTDAYGVTKLVDQMYRYRDVLGAQFEPCQLLKDYAKDNKKFHPE